MGVKCDVEESIDGRVLHARFHPRRCRGGRVEPHNQNFIQISEYKCPTGEYPLGNFYESLLFVMGSFTTGQQTPHWRVLNYEKRLQ